MSTPSGKVRTCVDCAHFLTGQRGDYCWLYQEAIYDVQDGDDCDGWEE